MGNEHVCDIKVYEILFPTTKKVTDYVYKDRRYIYIFKAVKFIFKVCVGVILFLPSDLKLCRQLYKPMEHRVGENNHGVCYLGWRQHL